MDFFKFKIFTLTLFLANFVFSAEVRRDAFDEEVQLTWRENKAYEFLLNIYQIQNEYHKFFFIDQVRKNKILLEAAKKANEDLIKTISDVQDSIETRFADNCSVIDRRLKAIHNEKNLNDDEKEIIKEKFRDFCNTMLQNLEKEKRFLDILQRNKQSHICVLFLQNKLTLDLVETLQKNGNLTADENEFLNLFKEIQKQEKSYLGTMVDSIASCVIQ